MPDADTLAVSGEPDEVRQLLALLRRDPELRLAGLALEVPKQTGGHLGAVADTVVAILTDEAVLTAASTTVGIWLAARSRPTRIRARRGDVEVEVETVKGKRAAEYTKELLDKLAKPEAEE
ncbi:hypothetical protein GCM10009830_47070 [Glycomyces endophyticus]|uniref:Uncharacterized protein n=1 Tax=Glycomyces endophyticus TaxID=480996 RepID=A0ABN2HVA5_9ACTN